MLFDRKTLSGRRAILKWRTPGVTIAFISVLCVIVVGHDMLRTWEARSRALEHAQREAANLTWSAAQQADAAFRLANAILVGLVERVETEGVAGGQLERLRRLMASSVTEAPLLQSLTLTDEAGVAIVGAGAVTRAVNLADREYFQYHRTHANVGPHIGAVTRSGLSDKWVVPVSRRVNHADGSFAGVVATSIEVSYFRDFYAAFKLGHDGAIGLWRDDGDLAAPRALIVPTVTGSAAPDLSVRSAFPKPTAGDFELVSPLDGITRTLSYRRLADFPVVAAAALGKDERLADWRADAAEHLLGAVLVTVLLGLIILRLRTQVRLRAQGDRVSAAAAAATNENLSHLSLHLAKARDRAEQANRAKSRFLAGVSHELRTPLNGILGYARLLRMEGGLNPAQAARVDAMLDAGKHLLAMITCVLDLSEIEAGHLELRPVEFDVQAVAAACVELVRPAAEAKGLTLSMAMAPGTPNALVADITRLRQILLNLLGNAAKFTPEGAIAARLRLSADGSALRIEVADTGPGIPAEMRKCLFQDFERLDAEVTAKVEGAGLGLALSSGLAAMMGGRLGYHDNPGGGSVFWLELPLDAVAAAPPAIVALAHDMTAIEAKTLPNRRLNVLVVDDIGMNRDIVGSFLRAGGHQVTCVGNGADAIAAATSTDFDVVLMDVRMSVIDGLEATRRIRALGGARSCVPIVALTAQVFTEQVALCSEAGMDGYLAKPFSPETLQAAVMQAMDVVRREGCNSVSAPSVMPDTRGIPAVSAIPVIGSELAVFDREVFERTASYLTPEAVVSYLEAISSLGASLLRQLREGGPRRRTSEALADEAHVLGGSASMLGFERLAAMGRRFERAVQFSTEEEPEVVAGLSAALEATLQSISDRL